MEIPFGISIIATVLKVAGHDVDLFVISPVTPLKKILQDYIKEKKPQLFCLSAVSSQFSPIEHVAALVKVSYPKIGNASGPPPFFQIAWLEQDSIRNTDLANIVHGRRV